MADDTELLASRWNDGLPVAGGPGINDLEAVLKLITGIPFATVISGGLGLNEKCQFTGQIWNKASGSGPSGGLRLTDTSGGGRDWLIFPNGDNIVIYENTGTESVPIWTVRSTIGQYGSAAGIGCTAYTSALSLTPSTNNIIALPNEVFDSSEFHDNTTNNSRFTIPGGHSGYYRATMVLSAGTGLQTPTVSLFKDGSTVVWSALIPHTSTKAISFVFPVLYMPATSYYEFRVNDFNGTASGSCYCSLECVRFS
jgi:hypothetical protein